MKTLVESINRVKLYDGIYSDQEGIIIGDPFKFKDWDWVLRILYYGKMARVLESMGVKKVEEDLYLDVIAQIFGDTLYLNKDAEFTDTESEIPDYWKKYTSSKLYSKKYFDAFKDASYDLKDFKEDVKSMCKTINTFKYKED